MDNARWTHISPMRNAACCPKHGRLCIKVYGGDSELYEGQNVNRLGVLDFFFTRKSIISSVDQASSASGHSTIT